MGQCPKALRPKGPRTLEVKGKKRKQKKKHREPTRSRQN